MGETWTVILGLAAATFGVRLSGYLLGRSLPQRGPLARMLNALPGSLIAALVAYLLVSGGPREGAAALAAAGAAVVTRSLPLTILVGVGAIWLLRQSGWPV
jgi:uncharacterized membrane protein